jgi:hypothetical protein
MHCKNNFSREVDVQVEIIEAIDRGKARNISGVQHGAGYQNIHVGRRLCGRRQHVYVGG